MVCPLSGSTSTDDHGITSYEWDFGDGTTGTGANPGHTYGSASTFTVTLKVTDGTPFPEGLYRVRAEGVTDEEMARLWEEVQAEHRSSARWGAGQRKKRRP